MTQTKLRPDPTKFYVAWQSAAGDVDGAPYAVVQGERLRGSHPLVRHMGAGGFVEDGTPRSEWPNVIDAAVESGDLRAAEAAKAAPRPSPPRVDPSTPVAALVQCTTSVLGSRFGTCEEGRVLLATDPIVAEVPTAFAPLQVD